MIARQRILIIGGGFTGLTAAYELSKHSDCNVTLLERSEHLGGLAGGFTIQGTHLEKAYHHLFRTDRDILELVVELGLEDRLMWCNSSVGIYREGRIHPFMSPMDVLRFPPCGLIGRLRLGFVALYLQKKRNWRRLAGQTAFAWMSKACGADAMRAIWEPLLRGKFDRYFDKVSMAWLWARIHIRANSRGSGGGGEQLGYFRGGFAELTHKLQAVLLQRGVQIQTNATVESFGVDEQFAVVNGRREMFDRCVFTGPSAVLSKLLPPGSQFEAYARQLESISYLGAICLVFVSEQDLGGPYWVNVNEVDAPFLVCIHHTRLVDKALYGSKHVYYLGSYRPHDGSAFRQTDEELVASWWAYLRKIFPSFDARSVVEKHVFRFKHAQHIVDTGFEERIPSYRTPLPGVYLANFSQVFPEDRGTNYAVREGKKIARMLREDLACGLETGPIA